MKFYFEGPTGIREHVSLQQALKFSINLEDAVSKFAELICQLYENGILTKDQVKRYISYEYHED